MKLALALAAVLGLSVSGAFAACGHDRTAESDSQKVASLDKTTTASTTAEKPAANDSRTSAPAEAD